MKPVQLCSGYIFCKFSANLTLQNNSQMALYLKQFIFERVVNWFLKVLSKLHLNIYCIIMSKCKNLPILRIPALRNRGQFIYIVANSHTLQEMLSASWILSTLFFSFTMRDGSPDWYKKANEYDLEIPQSPHRVGGKSELRTQSRNSDQIWKPLFGVRLYFFSLEFLAFQ